MQIMVNGEILQVADSITLLGLVDELGLAEKRIAIELNLEIIPRSEHANTNLKEADSVEIVHAIGGG